MSDWIFEIDDVLYNEDTGEMCMQPKYKGRLIRCKDCIKKDLCCLYRDTKEENGFCKWAERREE